MCALASPASGIRLDLRIATIVSAEFVPVLRLLVLTTGLEIGWAVETKNSARGFKPYCGSGPARGHGEMAACRPADDYDPLRVNIHAFAFKKRWEGGGSPGEGVANVGHSSVDEVNLRAEAVVDTDGEDAIGDKERCLSRPNRFAGEGHEAAAVDHKS